MRKEEERWEDLKKRGHVDDGPMRSFEERVKAAKAEAVAKREVSSGVWSVAATCFLLLPKVIPWRLLRTACIATGVIVVCVFVFRTVTAQALSTKLVKSTKQADVVSKSQVTLAEAPLEWPPPLQEMADDVAAEVTASQADTPIKSMATAHEVPGFNVSVPSLKPKRAKYSEYEDAIVKIDNDFWIVRKVNPTDFRLDPRDAGRTIQLPHADVVRGQEEGIGKPVTKSHKDYQCYLFHFEKKPLPAGCPDIK